MAVDIGPTSGRERVALEVGKIFDLANRLRDFLLRYGDVLQDKGRADLSEIIDRTSKLGSSAYREAKLEAESPSIAPVKVSIARDLLIDALRQFRGVATPSPERIMRGMLSALGAEADLLKTNQFKVALIASVHGYHRDNNVNHPIVIEPVASEPLPVVTFLREHLDDIYAQASVEREIATPS